MSIFIKVYECEKIHMTTDTCLFVTKLEMKILFIHQFKDTQS